MYAVLPILAILVIKWQKWVDLVTLSLIIARLYILLSFKSEVHSVEITEFFCHLDFM